MFKDDGLELFNSFAISEYLLLKYKSTLKPREKSEERSLYYQWNFWISSNLDGCVGKIMQHSLVLKPEERDTDTLEEEKKNFKEKYSKVLSDHLEMNEWMLGEKVRKMLKFFFELMTADPFLIFLQFSCVDVMLSWCLLVLDSSGLLDEHPVLKRYYSKILSRPSFSKCISPKIK